VRPPGWVVELGHLSTMDALMDPWLCSIAPVHSTSRNAPTSCPTRGNVAVMSHRQKSLGIVALELCRKQLFHLQPGNSAGKLRCSCGFRWRCGTTTNSFANRGPDLMSLSRSIVNLRIIPPKFFDKGNESSNSSKHKVYARK